VLAAHAYSPAAADHAYSPAAADHAYWWEAVGWHLAGCLGCDRGC